jgi:hypothetical protein
LLRENLAAPVRFWLNLRRPEFYFMSAKRKKESDQLELPIEGAMPAAVEKKFAKKIQTTAVTRYWFCASAGF